MEIESGLNRGLPMIPVIVDIAMPPREEELPDSLKPLSRKQGILLRQQNLEDGLSKLITRIDDILREAEEERRKRSRGLGVRDYFDVVLPTMFRWKGGRASQLTAEANCSIAFDVQGEDGGTWVLVLKPPKPHVHKGPMGNVDCTIKLSVRQMQDILSGQFDARAAIASGEVEISGDKKLLKVVGPLL
jgi:putative sterol carrier protein